MNLFGINSPVIQFLAKVGDLIILNILTLILSLPIVTIGAATTALHYAVDKVFTDEGTLLKNYFRAFKINFKQSTIYWLLLLVLSASCLVVLFFMEANAFSGVTRALCFGCLLVCCLVFVWVFPLQAVFNNTTWAMLRNAIICAFSWPVRSVLMVVLNLIPMIIIMAIDVGMFLKMAPLWLAGWLSICNCLCRYLLLDPMKQLKAGAQDEDTEPEEQN
jgi:uncharacterized membrane protein YesL